jgi:predicted nuclease of predicted toxin-antitoxin system
MKILVDENIPRMTVDHLTELGHDVRDIRGTIGQGVPDPDLWVAVMSERRMLVTTDRGFAAYRGPSHPGILIVRLRQPNRLKIHNAVMLAFDRFPEVEWHGMLVVVRDTTVSVSRKGGSVEQL